MTMPAKNEQSRILKNRLTIQTIVMIVVFTVFFLILAAFANTAIVPKIASMVVDATAEKIRFDPKDYVTKYSLDDLLDKYVQVLAQQGYIANIELIDTEGNKSEIKTETNGMVSGDTSIAYREAGNSEAESSSEIASDANAATDLNEDRTMAVAYVHPIVQKDSSDDYHDDDLDDAEYLTLRKLGYYAALSDFYDLTRTADWQSSDWDRWNEAGYDSYGPFQVRNLSAYHRIKEFKLPAAIVLYMLGCLIIVFWQLSRSLKYFDELSGAVAKIISDRTQPVELPPALSITQNELNSIRADALSDELAAKTAEERKDELVAYLAHDIRTPLTSILGYMSILDESPELPEKLRKKYIHTVIEKGERLEGLVNELFEITRYNLQRIPIEREHVDVRLFLDQIAEEFYPQGSVKNLSINVQVDAPDNAEFFVDPEKLARALGNIVRNAISYAEPETSVELKACRTDECWTISVTDNGREISSEHLETIFERFYREDGARSANSGGAGLGLAIAKEIVVAHNGTITAQSKDGVTVITMKLW